MQNKENILLLGGTGFIGKNIVEYFINNIASINYQLIVLSRNSERYYNENVVYEIGDYGDRVILNTLFAKWKFTKVFHLASSSVPISSNKNIENDIKGNLLSTIGLLDIMRDHNCPFILYLSSGGAVYGEKNHLIQEDESCTPISSYGIVKLTIENYLKLYQIHYGINYLILRISNPFGAFHKSEKQGVINIAIRKAISGESLEIWGDGNQSKDYIFIDDLVAILMKLIDSGVQNKIINLGAGRAYKLNTILKQIQERIPGFSIKYIESKSTDIKDFCLDISLLQSIIDFEFTDFNTAIDKTVAWEKNNITKA
ncbi:NAD-dependent epimerase/dehydratase family protein [Flavobacterium sp. DG1-102-2]|uniref:NAD-dependent epimerase/dehydratase family protein n=1 Tax=Flavobacterium sp. DG1-102-2 TaxID=3081663 RepID=UPI0029493297|nr:NAD-dependent epimerase/dehydratase family protein [Flavobacterium sp. DG1-102-2]MDV6168386.1 NAD-dependent epimerase/dehydratase family protein [Flavobacterium sp. DG1-102-2]